jgi:hypothetical protein
MRYVIEDDLAVRVDEGSLPVAGVNRDAVALQAASVQAASAAPSNLRCEKDGNGLCIAVRSPYLQ